jgi:hypothetical protein
MAPPFVSVDELKCVDGSTNIDCNDTGVPDNEVARSMGAAARAPLHCR